MSAPTVPTALSVGISRTRDAYRLLYRFVQGPNPNPTASTREITKTILRNVAVFVLLYGLLVATGTVVALAVLLATIDPPAGMWIGIRVLPGTGNAWINVWLWMFVISPTVIFPKALVQELRNYCAVRRQYRKQQEVRDV